MKQATFFFTLFIITLVASAQTTSYDMVPYRKDTLWGFSDFTKTVLIQPQYDDVTFFKDEITAVRKNDKWGFIDKHGKSVMPVKYDLAGEFSEGMCQVRMGNLTGYVNNKGKEVIKPSYHFSNPFFEGVAVVSDSVRDKLVSKVIDKNGKVLLSDIDAVSTRFHSGFLAVQEQNKTYFIDKNGKRLKLPEGAELYFEFAEDAAVVMLNSKKRDTTSAALYYLGIINTSGKMVGDTVKDVFGNKIAVSTTQNVVSNFVNGFAIVQRSASQNFADNKKEYAFLDRSGKMSMWFSAVRAFSEDGRSLVVPTADSTVRVIDTKFRTIPPSILLYDAGTFSEGMLRVKLTADGKWGYINEKGEVAIDAIYDECSDFSGGIAAVTLNGKRGFVNKTGLQFWQN